MAILLLAAIVVIPTYAAEAITPDTESWYGDGSADVFELDSEADFLGFFSKIAGGESFVGKTVLLTVDVDLNPGWDASTMVAPANMLTRVSAANHFCGTFDGQGHTVKGLYAKPNVNDTGIFGKTATGDDVTIRNVRFLNSYVDISGVWRATALMNTAGGKLTIDNVYSEMICKSKGSSGSFGSAFTGNLNTASVTVIRNSVYAGKITAATCCGAFIGQNKGTATLENCAFYGEINDDTTNKLCSGLVDDNRGTLTIKNCISAGTVTANSSGNVNTICRNAQGTVTAENNLHLSAETIADASVKIGALISAEELADFYKWSDDNPDKGFASWDVIGDKPYPTTLAWGVKGVNSSTVCLKYWQKSAVVDGAYRVRLIGGVDSLDYDSLEIKLNIRNAEGKVGTVAHKVTKVWSSILADGETVTAENLSTAYIWGVALTGIPEAQSAIDLDAAVYTVKDNTKTLVSVHSILVGGAE